MQLPPLLPGAEDSAQFRAAAGMALLLFASCAPSSGPRESALPPVAAAQADSASSGGGSPTPVPPTGELRGDVAVPDDSVPAQLPPFAPPDFEPPSQRSAADGDGHWSSWPEGATHSLLFRATVHPHQQNRFVRMDVLAMDLRRARLHWTLGGRDDERGLLTDEPYGLIPAELQDDTLVIFNGGFQLRHGRWGIQARGVTVQKLKDEGCVVGIGNSGERVELGSWSRLSEHQEDFDIVRQTPPCLLESGVIHSDLVQGKTRAWAGLATDRRTRRRSALGIDEAGTTLYYAVGTETEPIDLARGLQAVGAVHALQLDINWNWTRCLVPGRGEDGVLRVASSLIDGMAWDKNEYFTRPSARDFFYLTESSDAKLSVPSR